MNGNPDQQPSLNLPPVGGEQPSSNGTSPGASSGAERAPSFEVGQNPSAPLLPDFPTMQTPSDPAAIPIPQAPFNQSTVVSQAPSPQAIDNDDQDLIPKEWVIKAKHIVERTREDPYSQNLEFSKFKASYIKDRYGMTVKVENE